MEAHENHIDKDGRCTKCGGTFPCHVVKQQRAREAWLDFLTPGWREGKTFTEWLRDLSPGT